jgi:WD40 repeat protein
MVAPPKNALKLDATKTHLYNEINIGSPLISCRYEPKGRFVFAGAQDFHVWRWDHAAGKKMQLKGADAWVRAIAFSLDGKTMLTGGYDGRLLWWPIDGDKPARAIDAHHGWVKSVAVSPDGKLIATSGNDQLIKLWAFADGKLVRTLEGHESPVYNIAFHPNGRQLASSDLKCNIFDWEIATGKLARKLKAEKMHTYDKLFKVDVGGARSMQFNADGTKLAIGGVTNVTHAFGGVQNPSVVMIDWKSGKNLMQHLAKVTFKGIAWGISLHPNGMVIAGAGGHSGGQLYFWNKDGKNEFHKFKLKDTCRDLHLSPDPTRFVTAHYDGHLRICRMTAKG